MSETPDFVKELEEVDGTVCSDIKILDPSLYHLVVTLYKMVNRLYGLCESRLKKKERREIDKEMDVIEYLMRQHIM